MTNNDYLNDVLNYGMDHGIGFKTSREFSKYTPSGSDPSHKQIVINTNWHDPAQLPYQAAHEIAHVLHEDPGVLYFVPTAKSGCEADANRGAIDILVPMYFADVEPEDANVNDFLQAFSIPAYMHDATCTAVREYYAGVSLDNYI